MFCGCFREGIFLVFFILFFLFFNLKDFDRLSLSLSLRFYCLRVKKKKKVFEACHFTSIVVVENELNVNMK